MDLNSFAAFLTVAEEKNVTRAAKRLFVTQQSLSGQIKRLEEHYHVTLFQRRPFFQLTPEGEAMAFYARQMLDSERAMASRFADLSHAATGILHLGLSHQRSGAFFPGIWSRYHQEYANISLRLREAMTNQLLEDLRMGSLDLIIGVDIPVASDLVIVPLAQEQMRCIMNESLLREYFPDDWQTRVFQYASEGVNLLELTELPLILPASSNRLRRPIDQLFRTRNTIPHISLETGSHSLILQLGCQGDGIAIVNPLSMYEQLRTQGVFPPGCHSFLIRDLPKQSVSLAYRSDTPLPLYGMGMVNAVVEEFQYYTDFLARFTL